MKLQEISLFALNIPFKQVFAHHRAQRSATESVWVQVQSNTGKIGYGEACPRSYVSGESLASIQAFFQLWASEWLADLDSLPRLLSWGIEKRPLIRRDPAAWCAFELALLDLLAKEQKCSVESLLGLGGLSEAFSYTAVLGLASQKQSLAQVQQYLAWGFRDFKLKISGDMKRDVKCLTHLLEMGCRVRVDANNLWGTTAEALTYFKQLDCPLLGIEEPLMPARQYEALAELAMALNTPIILDESCLGPEDIALLPEGPDWIINLRVSKMGGVLRTLETAQQAKDRNIPLIVGAQVGETSLLTRAALTVAQAFRGDILAQEGAFGTHLLQEDLVEPCLIFGTEGKLSPPPPDVGWGLFPRSDVSLNRLEQFAA